MDTANHVSCLRAILRGMMMGGTDIGAGITEEEEVVIHKSIILIIPLCPLPILAIMGHYRA